MLNLQKHLKKLFLVCTLILVFISCGTIKPSKPQANLPIDKNEFEIVTNQVVVPIEIDLTNYLKQANSKVPKLTKGSANPCEGIRYTYEFTKDSFLLSTKNNELNSELYGSYWIKMEYCAQCTGLFTEKPICIIPTVPFSCGINEQKPALKIQLATKLDISPEYQITSNTRLEDLKSIHPCEVTIFKFDATSEVLKEVKKTIDKQTIALDKELENIKFKSEAASLWKELYQVIHVPQFGYLHIQPQKLSLSKLNFDKNKLKTTMVLDCNTFLNQDSIGQKAKPLPALTRINKIPNDTFEVVTNIELHYDSLSKMLTEQLRKKELTIQGKQFVFDSVSFNGLNSNQVLLGIQFSGSKKGILYLLGTPHFNNDTKVFSLENISYDLETSSLLLKTAKWLFSNRIYEELRKACRVDLTNECTLLRKEIEKSLSQKHGDVHIKSKVHQLSVSKIQVTPEKLNLKAGIQAQMKITNY